MSAGKSVKHYEGFFEETLSGFSRLASCNGLRVCYGSEGVSMGPGCFLWV